MGLELQSLLAYKKGVMCGGYEWQGLGHIHIYIYIYSRQAEDLTIC